MACRKRREARSGEISMNLLTERERQVLEWAGRGLSMKGIARQLGISSGTVSWHSKNSYQKLGAVSREDALKKARAEGLIESAFSH